MSESELAVLLAKLQAAKCPEDIYGDLSGTGEEKSRQAKAVFRKLVRLAYEDYYPQELKESAREAFRLVNKWWGHAEDAIEKGIYGQRKKDWKDPDLSPKNVVIQSRKRQYVVIEPMASGDIADLYRGVMVLGSGNTDVVLKVVRDPDDNEFGENEARIIKYLRADKDGESLHQYLPNLVESFFMKEDGKGKPRLVNVFPDRVGLYSIAEILEIYYTGVELRHLIWMWKRVLGIMGYVHSLGVVHGAILPSHILYHIQSHGVLVVDWSYAVQNPERSGERIRAISEEYKDYYAPEIFQKRSPTPATDIYMIAKCMTKLLNGDVKTGEVAPAVPQELRDILRDSTRAAPSERPSDAWELHRKLDELVPKIFGERKFLEFRMEEQD